MDEVVLLSSFRLLSYLVYEIYQIEAFIGAAVLETLEPYLRRSISETSIEISATDERI